MTTLDAHAVEVRAAAAAVNVPSAATILVTLIGLVPFLLGWIASAVTQFVALIAAAAVHGWRTGQRQMGAPPRGGS